MNHSRRAFFAKSGQIAATGVIGGLAVGCTQSSQEDVQASPASSEDNPDREAESPKAMVAACGLSCMACPLMKAGTCKGCASGKEASEEMLAKKPCPVLKCAAMKGIDYCGTGCGKFTECDKMIGHPYAQTFMDMMKKRMNASS